MYFLLVFRPDFGRLVHHEVLLAGPEVPAFDDPFWLRVDDRTQAVKAAYPGAEIIKAMASSLEAFMHDHPEYGPFPPG